MQSNRADKQAIRKLLKGRYFVLILIIIAIGIVGSIVSPNFFKANNFQNIIRNMSVTGILGVGMTFVIITGGIDLSVGGVLALSAIMGALYATKSVLTFSLMALLIGCVCGCVTGLIIITERVPAFIGTLGVLNMTRGLCYMVTKSTPIYFSIENYDRIPNTRILGIPLPGVIFLAVALVGWFILRYTIYGRNVYAVGSNTVVARYSGINVKLTLFLTYLISGICCAIAGIVYTSYTSVAQPGAADAYEMSAITMSVIGGTLMTGGVGGIPGTILGAIIINLMKNIFNLLGFQTPLQTLLTGAILVMAVLLQSKKPEA